MRCRFFKFFLLIAVSISSFSCKDIGVEPVSRYQVALRGFTYTSFDTQGFQQGHASDAFHEMIQQTGSEWAALCIFEYQSTSTSHDIAPNTNGINPLTQAAWSTTSTRVDLLQGIQDARSFDKKIMLKPHVDLYTGAWRAAINPDTAWFSAYAAMVMKYALLADSNGIEMFCIGDEYVVATQSKFTASWKKIISQIRKIYHGKLVYASNWSGAYEYGITTAEFQQVEFWSDLDYIGIDAYYPITNSVSDNIPSLNDAMNILALPLHQIELVSRYYGKPVILTETGIQSVKGALAEPWNSSLGAQPNAVQDQSVQEFYYHATIETFGRQHWCSGIFWWNWESIVTTNEKTNFTIRNKSAAETLKKYYETQ
jgi:hypothetical protein